MRVLLLEEERSREKAPLYKMETPLQSGKYKIDTSVISVIDMSIEEFRNEKAGRIKMLRRWMAIVIYSLPTEHLRSNRRTAQSGLSDEKTQAR